MHALLAWSYLTVAAVVSAAGCASRAVRAARHTQPLASATPTPPNHVRCSAHRARGGRVRDAMPIRAREFLMFTVSAALSVYRDY